MKLQRESIKSFSDEESKRGTHLYYILDKDAELLEKAEAILCTLEAPFSVNGSFETWYTMSDTCPLYNEGISSGFWIPVEYIDDFKEAWKETKHILKAK